MEHSASSETNRFSASQEIPSILWNLEVHFRVHKRPPPAPILKQINPVDATLSHSLKIDFNIIFPTSDLILRNKYPYNNIYYALRISWT